MTKQRRSFTPEFKREAADLVGMDKLMWGSDYPRTITAITYRMSYDFVSKSAELTEHDKALFLGENARGVADLSKAGELGLYSAYNLIKRFAE